MVHTAPPRATRLGGNTRLCIAHVHAAVIASAGDMRFLVSRSVLVGCDCAHAPVARCIRTAQQGTVANRVSTAQHAGWHQATHGPLRDSPFKLKPRLLFPSSTLLSSKWVSAEPPLFSLPSELLWRSLRRAPDGRRSSWGFRPRVRILQLPYEPSLFLLVSGFLWRSLRRAPDGRRSS